MKIRAYFVSNSSSDSFIVGSYKNISDSIPLDITNKRILKDIKSKLEVLLEFYNKFYNQNRSFSDMFDEPFICDKEYLSTLIDFGYSGKCIGLPVISSASDNSIPYTLQEIIEDKFEAERIHLG